MSVIGHNANVDGPGDGVVELNVLDPAFRPDSAAVAAARAANWYARTPIGFAVLRHREATALLADQLEWHRREDKAGWWEFFRLKVLTDEDLLDERGALSGLVHNQRLSVAYPNLKKPRS